MHAVIFEFSPAKGKIDEYMGLAAQLRPQMEQIDGFISIERFASLGDEGKFLSLSFWRDEQAIADWRNLEAHRLAQHQGRQDIFQDYRLRVARVDRDYGMHERDQAPHDSRDRHDHDDR